MLVAIMQIDGEPRVACSRSEYEIEEWVLEVLEEKGIHASSLDHAKQLISDRDELDEEELELVEEPVIELAIFLKDGDGPEAYLED